MTLTDWFVAGLALTALGAVIMMLVQADNVRRLRVERDQYRDEARTIRRELRQLRDYTIALNAQAEAWLPAVGRRPPRAPAPVVPFQRSRRIEGIGS